MAAMGAGEFEEDGPAFLEPGVAVADEFVTGQVAGARGAFTGFLHGRITPQYVKMNQRPMTFL